MDVIESAVKHLHSLGILHRDINLQNFMFREKREAGGYFEGG